MSIFPVTDLVSDVASAAEPRRLQVAMRRLVDLSQTGAPNQTAFAVATPAPAATPPTGMIGLRARSAALQQTTAPTGAASSPDVLRKFEAFIIQSALETILPKSDHGLYGDAASGGVWRSMMAEQLGAQIAKAGGVGIQKVINGRWAAPS